MTFPPALPKGIKISQQQMVNSNTGQLHFLTWDFRWAKAQSVLRPKFN